MSNQLSFYTAIIALVIFLAACQKDEVPKPLPEQSYPTTYKQFSSGEWEVRNAEFQKINIHEGLSLNKFGFVNGKIVLNDIDSLTEEFVVQKLEYIIETYKSFLGIPNSRLINVKNDFRIPVPLMVGGSATLIEYYFDALEEFKQEEYWPEIESDFAVQHYYLTQNSIENKAFVGPTLYVVFDDAENTITISGNWLPGAYTPLNNIYSVDEAVATTYQFILNETGQDLWEEKHTFGTSKVFVSLEKGNEITVNECWRIRVTMPTRYHFYIFVDTQTGEVIFNYKRSMYYI